MRRNSGEWRVASGEWKAEDGKWKVSKTTLSTTHYSLSTNRRGILLILVLAVLAMFSLIAVAFVVLTGHYRRITEGHKRIEAVTDPPQELLRQAFMQVAHGPTTATNGTPDPASRIGPHSLLEDIYGNEYAFGQISTTGSPSYVTGFQQLVNIPIGSLSYYNTSGAETSYSNIGAELARRVGCVLTITSVPGGVSVTDAQKALYGQSTRIVGVNLSTTPPEVQVVAFSNGALPYMDATTATRFTINGVPFSGTGFGYNPDNDNLDLSYHHETGEILPEEASGVDIWPVALLPNLPLATYLNATTNPLGLVFGGANEDYDVADYQNVMLAAQAIPTGGTIVQTLPSLHRPALVRYWFQRLMDENGLWPGGMTPADKEQVLLFPYGIDGIRNTGDDPSTVNSATIDLIVALKRKIILRPLHEDNPNFNGSNPYFNPAWDGVTANVGQWDVDNGGDGVADSVWIDAGLPVRQTADGRLYKPLVAVLCVDLDGRFNLNAHGSLAQTDSNYSTATLPLGGAFAGGSISARGSGLGPADVNLYYLFEVFGTNTYPRILMLGNGTTHQGRYGTDGAPGTATRDVLNENNWFEYGMNHGWGANYWTFNDVDNAGSYGSPPDPFGVGAVGLDQAGRPLFVGMTDTASNYRGYGSGVANSPYELNLDANQYRGLPSTSATIDNPFSPAELERILRPYDIDSPDLPDRLAQLTTTTAGDPKDSVLLRDRRLLHAITTESWDLPAPNVTQSSLSASDRGFLPDGRAKHVTDLLRARLRSGGVSDAQVMFAMSQLLPPDLLAGLRMDINRPFGDGLDNAPTNGIVDEPGEDNGTSFYYDGSGTLASNSLEARQLMARYLYVLAMLVADTDEIRNHLGGGATNADVARFLAQWAVNAVDFKDRDSIMTPFEYDIHPFANDDSSADGSAWDVDGVFGGTPSDDAMAYRGVVWGCERPELLISETLAFHDRRTEDRDDEQYDPAETPETGAGTTSDAMPDKDSSFDQRFKPEGSLFIELFNPWSEREPRSGDLYSAPNGGVDLTRVSSNTIGDKYPAWRMVIVDQVDASKDPDDPDTGNLPTIESAIYFVYPDTATNVVLPSDGDVQFYPDNAHDNRIAPVLPGRYAVVGPGKAADTGPSITYLGFKSGDNPGTVNPSPNTTRRIELNPNANPDTTGQVEIYNDGTADELSSFTIKNPTAVVITTPTNQRLSISEPEGGYSNTGPDGSTAYSPTNGYTPNSWDIPLDTNSTVSGNVKNAIFNNGRADNLKVVHLQRLANPLMPFNDNPTNPNYNPYRTIDSMPIDLVAFNGLDVSSDPKVTSSTNNEQFYARQRGQHNDAAGALNIWSKEPNNGSPTALASRAALDLTTYNFNLKNWPLHHTLGFLNDPYGLPTTDATTGERGLPATPFPWLTWNNRPYVSPYELMQVSWLRSSRLLDWYRMNQGSNPYMDAGLNSSFSHLTNFFLSGAPGTPDEELHRVFEFLRVPSPFVGADVQASSAAVNGAHNFHPPFNHISTYREPGKINLNTIYNERVFNGLMNGITDVSWSNFVDSRRGYGGGSSVLVSNSDYPTFFSKPFRSFGGAELTPTLPGDRLEYDREIDATLLRCSQSDDTRPLFQHDSTTAQVDNTDRNPYFRYQGIQRLNNLVTTRSNVYAVWITVGYFEVTPNTTNYNVYPDGYELGRELGVDTGEIERHKAFFIFDRSIPVGFQRGRDLNVDKAILVERYIE